MTTRSRWRWQLLVVTHPLTEKAFGYYGMSDVQLQMTSIWKSQPSVAALGTFFACSFSIQYRSILLWTKQVSCRTRPLVTTKLLSRPPHPYTLASTLETCWLQTNRIFSYSRPREELCFPDLCCCNVISTQAYDTSGSFHQPLQRSTGTLLFSLNRSGCIIATKR